MAGWEVSRHPEWDLMYLAGLTVREISDLCRQVPATVHSHVRVREKYEPGYQAKHEEALNARGPNRPTTLWRKRAAEAADFFATFGRLPKSDGSRAERSLHRWISVQRRAHQDGKLPESKVVLLQKVTGWNERTKQQDLDLHWREVLEQLKSFVDEHGSLPRYKTFESDLEHSLGVWLHNQHQMRTEEKLLEWRRQELNRSVPGWRRRT